VTSPGFEKYLPGADTYIRAKYPAVDGLDGLFRGYVSGLKYADLNRRGFLELTVSKDQAVGTFQLMDGVDSNTGASLWSSETVVATQDLKLTVNQQMSWEPTWRELDLVFGIAKDGAGNQIQLNPESFASTPRAGVQLADITLAGSEESDRIFAGVGSLVDAAGGNDELFNTESQGGNLLIGGLGSDDFYLNAADDVVIGGRLISDASGPRFSISYPNAAIIDQAKDKFFILSDPATGNSTLSIADYELGIDQAFIDGNSVSENWQQAKADLLKAGVVINAAPVATTKDTPSNLILVPGVRALVSPTAFGNDPDSDRLSLVVLDGPVWITNAGNSISINTPEDLKAEDLASLNLELGLYDGQAITPFNPKLVFQAAPVKPANGSTMAFTTPEGAVKTFTLNPFGGEFKKDKKAELKSVESEVNTSDTSYRDNVANAAVTLAERSLDFEADVEEELTAVTLGIDLNAFVNTLPTASKHLTYYSIDSQGKVAPLTYNPLKGGGARFYDRSGDGVADFLSLKLVDGGYGDKDGVANGVIVDPSTLGTADIDPVLQINAGGILKAYDPINTAAAASLFLKATLESLPSSANQIGYVVLEENQVSLSLDIDTIKRQSKTLFSTLESSDVVLPGSTSFISEILLLNNQNVRFFEVSDGTLDQLTSANDARLRFLTGSLRNSSSAQFSSTSGVRFILNLQDTNQGLSALIGQEQGTAAVLDFTSFSPGETVRGTLHMGREANYDSVTGFYRTLDATGAVRNALGDVLRPGEVGYSTAALRTENRVDALSGLTIGDNQTSSRAIELRETTFIAPFAQVNGNTFFTFAAANTDKISHFRVLGTNKFGLEDQLGGGDLDFDDNVLVFKFETVI